MPVVAVTGGIGSGKSTVAAMLAERGAVVIDADAVTHRLQQPGQAVYQAIVARFGAGVVGPDGGLDRPALARTVFADAAALAALEAIVHPAVAAEKRRQLDELADPDAVVVYDVPLLTTCDRDGYQAVLVVDADPEVAVDRLVEQRGMAADDARARLARQMTRADRRALADRVIDNSGTLADLRREVDAAWDWILGLRR
ncbi:MAG: dephospho-CoA kinase [Acidimicrobiia bacterium]